MSSSKECVHVPDVYQTPTGTLAQIDEINAQNAANGRLYRAVRFLLRKDFGLDHVPEDPRAFLSSGDAPVPAGVDGLGELQSRVDREKNELSDGDRALVTRRKSIQDQEKKVRALLDSQAMGGQPPPALGNEQEVLRDMKDALEKAGAAHEDLLNRYREDAATLDAKKNAFSNDHIRFLAVYGLLKADNWDPAGGRTQPGPDDQRLPLSAGEYEIIARPFADALVSAVKDYTSTADLYRKVYEFLKTQRQPS